MSVEAPGVVGHGIRNLKDAFQYNNSCASIWQGFCNAPGIGDPRVLVHRQEGLRFLSDSPAYLLRSLQ
jgi:hypothetical protein